MYAELLACLPSKYALKNGYVPFPRVKVVLSLDTLCSNKSWIDIRFILQTTMWDTQRAEGTFLGIQEKDRAAEHH